MQICSKGRTDVARWLATLDKIAAILSRWWSTRIASRASGLSVSDMAAITSKPWQTWNKLLVSQSLTAKVAPAFTPIPEEARGWLGLFADVGSNSRHHS